MASINDTARNSGGMMRSTKLESELTDSGRARLREVPVILKDGRTAAIVHLRANHTGEAGEEGRDQA